MNILIHVFGNDHILKYYTFKIFVFSFVPFKQIVIYHYIKKTKFFKVNSLTKVVQGIFENKI